MSEEQTKRPRWVVLMLTLMPLWLLLSAGGAVWWSLRDDKEKEEERNQRFVQDMSVERIADDMRKLVEVIGPRDPDHPENLMRAAAMIDGTLGPSNTGYQIQRIPGPAEAPIIRASLEQSRNEGRSIWVVASYDTTSGGPEFSSIRSDSSSVAAIMALAQAMAKDDLPTDIHFLVLPDRVEDPFSTRRTMANQLVSIMEPPAMVICLAQMNTGTTLVANTSKTIYTKNPTRISPSSFHGLGIIHNDADFFGHLMPQDFNGAGLTVIEFHTIPNTKAETEAANIAISTGKLVEWLRRAARLEAAK